MGQESNGQHLLDALDAGVYATNTQGRLLAINPAGLRMLGRTGQDLTGQQMHQLVHYQSADGQPLPEESCPLLRVAVTGISARDDDDTFWRADGTPLPVSWMSAPSRQDGEVTGAVVAFFDNTNRHDATERLLAEREAAVADNARLAILGRVSEALSTLDVDEALRRLARLTVGPIADWCIVDAVNEGVVRRVGVAHNDPTGEAEIKYVRPMPPLMAQATGSLARVLLTGTQQVVTELEGDAVSRVTGSDPLDREQAALLDELGCRHALVTPFVVRRQVYGAMTWVRTSDQPFTDQDRSLATEVAHRAAIALDNARRYSQQREAAEALQRSLLTVLPEPDHLHITARYLPASEGVEIGGDWYDAFLLSDGATSLVIGDILGHDLTAAAHMGQVRNILRGIAADRLAPPSEILTRLDQALAGLKVGALATCVLATIEQTPQDQQAGLRHLRWSSAGHLPPAVVSADGHVRFLEQPGDLMLGVAPELPRHDHTSVIQPGDTIWLYTDGLVERSDQPLDQALIRLRRALAAVAHQPLNDACDLLLDRMLPDGHPDDVALLAVRAHPQDQPRPQEAGPAHA